MNKHPHISHVNGNETGSVKGRKTINFCIGDIINIGYILFYIRIIQLMKIISSDTTNGRCKDG